MSHTANGTKKGCDLRNTRSEQPRGNRGSLFEKEINKKLFCGSPRRDREPNERGSEELERERMVSSHWEKGGAKQNRTEKNGE